MLTPEQRAIRATGIGASEIACVAGLHPYRGPLDVWVTKPTASRPPLTEERADDDESPQEEVGSLLEDGLRALYTKRTGIKLEAPRATYRHPQHAAILASPDGIAVGGSGGPDGGFEAKVVGSWMAHHWDDGVPDYVLAQAAQNMAVLGAPWWDVGALLGGTTFRIWRVHRDLGFEQALIDAGNLFWELHVLGDLAPDPVSAEEQKRILLERYPGSEKTACRRVEDDTVLEALRWLREAKAQIKALEAAELQLTNALCEVIGNDYGIEGGGSKLLWIPNRGAVNWKEIANELAGSVPLELVEKHRGRPYRAARLIIEGQKRSTKKGSR
jgi:predicted phage-related endonuclease